MKVYGPDGRVWVISRRATKPGPLASLRPGGRWVVEAETDNEIRRWEAASRHAAGVLVGEVALTLRTGAEGPAGELPPDEDPFRSDAPPADDEAE